MRLNTLQPALGAKKEKVRVGRGWSSGVGKTCGKGGKGQTARGKGKVAIGFEGGQMPFHRRIPKSGFNSWKTRASIEVRLSELNKVPGDVADITVLKLANIIPGHVQFVKVINTGVIEKAITVKGMRMSQGARDAIQASGGKVEE